MPILGRTRRYKICYLNTGHGTLGWTQAAGSATLVADIIEGKTPEIMLQGLISERRSKRALYEWNGGNVWLFKQINGLHGGEAYDQVMLGISRAADYHHFPYYLAGLLVYALIALMLRNILRRGGNTAYLTMWLGIFLVLSGGFAAEAVVIKTLKTHFAYTRPYAALPPGDVHVVEKRTDPEDAHHSFPSGHTAFATLMVIGLWPALSILFRVLGLCAIVSVMWSRMALGMHFPADVLGSFFIMLALVLIIRSVLYMALRRWFHLNC